MWTTFYAQRAQCWRTNLDFIFIFAFVSTIASTTEMYLPALSPARTHTLPMKIHAVKCMVLFALFSVAACKTRRRATDRASKIVHQGRKHRVGQGKGPICVDERITFWSSDLHIAPPQDMKNMLALLSRQPGFPELTMLDKSLSDHCHITQTCATDLRVINRTNMLALTCDVKKAFWQSYAADPEMATVDAFVVSYAMPSTLLYLPFDRPILLIVPVRYEVGAADPAAWKAWTAALQAMARGHKRFVIVANSLFDAKYVQYFTGLGDNRVTYMPSYCDVPVRYAPRDDLGLLIMPRRIGAPGIVDEIKREFERYGRGLKADWLPDLYANYEMSQLAQHRAIIFLPYTVSVMTFFELYRMAIPIFVPSKQLLIKWHLQHNMLSEMTWPAPRGKPSPLPPAKGFEHWPDPNDDIDPDSLDFWLEFADMYTFSNLIYFDSIDDLVEKAILINDYKAWTAISAAMESFSELQLAKIMRTWRDILIPRLFGADCHHRPSSDMLNVTYAQAVAKSYPGVPHGC